MNNTVTRRQVTDRAGNRIEPPPMATYCEPSQQAIIRARDAQAGQRIDRDRREAMALLRTLESVEGPLLQQLEPAELPLLGPALNAEFIAGLITGLALSAVVAGALLIGSQL